MQSRLEDLKSKLGAPFLSGQVYCVGRNFAKHAEELGNDIPSEPLLFHKNAASIKAAGETNNFLFDDELHFEAELVILVAKDLKLGTKLNDESFIEGFFLGLDLTRRSKQSELKSKGHPWLRAKNFEGSAILGPFVTRNIQSEDIDFEFSLNGQLRQRADCSRMMFSPTKLLNSLLELNSVYKGDLIFCGTPQGVGVIKKGDRYSLVSKALAYELDAII